MLISGSVFLITGGASGMGRAAAEVLLQEGAHLTILDLQRPLQDANFQFGHDRVLFLQVDVTSEKDVLNAMDATKRKFGKLNGVLNCAAVFSTAPIYDFKTLEPHSKQIFMKILDVNLCGTFNVIRLAIGLLAENEPDADGERGIIINTSR
ncbi:3-hydroxyacyl-CoA dehydrogenase type-2-like [Dendroctonus ponderosae]|uniref:3-hydroxyacyl-CoA dehydrogenase type-2-like n=1 Tax=Dendroctonus ponderosae TaxID=77166 RepID=UPI002036615F|nr:3-hydroxyacyl-CoA dehydrogenase type-2-like [Dendroctonus ponderosae]